jgi:hypothetical protein
MTEKIRFLKEKGKYVSKETLKFYSRASLEDLERAEQNAVTMRHWWYEEMEKAGTYGPDNPPPASGLDYHRWLLKKYGLRWYVAYARRREYANNLQGIPGRLRAMQVPEDEIEAVMNPREALRRKISKVCAIANRLKGSRSDALRQGWAIVRAGTFETKIAGVTFGNRQTALKRLTSYDPSEIRVSLVPEPDNPVDRNAVAVMVGIRQGNLYKLGYIPSENAKMVRALKGSPCIEVLPGTTYGARINIAI